MTPLDGGLIVGAAVLLLGFGLASILGACSLAYRISRHPILYTLLTAAILAAEVTLIGMLLTLAGVE